MENEDFQRLLLQLRPTLSLDLQESSEPSKVPAEPSQGEGSAASPTSLLPFLLGAQSSSSSISIYGVLELCSDAQYFQSLAAGSSNGAAMLCVRDVPDVLVPTDALAALLGAAPLVDTLKFFRQCDRDLAHTYTHTNTHAHAEAQREKGAAEDEVRGQRYAAVLVAQSLSAALQIQRDYDALCMSSAHRSVCAVQFVCAAHIVRMHAEGETQATASASAALEDNGDVDFVTLSDLRALIDDDSLSLSVPRSAISIAPSVEGEREKCAVCLGELSHGARCAADDAEAEVVLGCSHRFHWRCLVHLDRPQCPVCRFQHDEGASENVLCCSVCQWPAQRSAKSAAFSSSSSVAPAALSLDVHLCLLCGFTGCPAHITQHCRESAHTYALNTADQSVFDFAGEGFVSRLALSLADEDEELFAADSPSPLPTQRAKLTEMPRESSLSRRALRPLSEREEDEFVAHKLEDALAQYNRVLAWRLSENRAFYEQQLRLVRESSARGAHGERESESGVCESERDREDEGERAEDVCVAVSRSLVNNIKSSLSTEKQRLLQQCESMRQKIAQAEKERDVAQVLHTHLARNRDIMLQKLLDMQSLFDKTQRELSVQIPVLEERVQRLMRSLDSTSCHAQAHGTAAGEETTQSDIGKPAAK